MKVEYAVLYEDKTGDTIIVEVPAEALSGDGASATDELTNWAIDNLGPQLVYRKAVTFAIYSLPSEEE